MGCTSAHWDGIYRSSDDEHLSWYQPVPAYSLGMLIVAGAEPGTAIVDVGGGTSLLIDTLLGEGYKDLTLVDVSSVALERARHRLAGAGDLVEWIRADARTWRPERTYDVWHDRAVFHFLVDPDDRAAYRRTVEAAVAPGGSLVVAAFALPGPERCSGLPVLRYDAAGLAAEFEGFDLTAHATEEHHTPRGVIQPFTWVALRRSSEG